MISKLESLGHKIGQKEAAELAEIVREKALSLKRALFDSEIIDTFNSFKAAGPAGTDSKNKGVDK